MVSDYSATLKLRSFAVLLGLADGGESRCNSLSSLEVELSTWYLCHFQRSLFVSGEHNYYKIGISLHKWFVSKFGKLFPQKLCHHRSAEFEFYFFQMSTSEKASSIVGCSILKSWKLNLNTKFGTENWRHRRPSNEAVPRSNQENVSNVDNKHLRGVIKLFDLLCANLGSKGDVKSRLKVTESTYWC